MVVRIIADLSNRLGLKPLLFKFSLFINKDQTRS